MDETNSLVQKKFTVEEAQELYLFDLELANVTVNQGLTIDEEFGVMFATQVYNGFNGKQESFIVSRTSLGGKFKDQMIFRNGGHGTSIGIDKESGRTYLWTNMIEVDRNDQIRTQWLCRVPYVANTTIDIHHSSVQRIKEFPNPNIYQTPFSDSKNNLLALRISERISGKLATRIEVYKVNDAKNQRWGNLINSFSFTPEMNSQVLQGLAIDNNHFYVTFGQSAHDFHLYRINLSNGTIMEEFEHAIGHSPDGEYVRGFGEPEGLYLYTDPFTKYKTLLTVIVGDLAGRRRQRLFALSSNIGVQKFLGLAGESVQRVPLTRNDNKAKRFDMNRVTSISQIREPGSYYMTTVEGNTLSDHPKKNVAGWWLYVSGGDSGSGINYGCHQLLVRNSVVHAEVYSRVVPSTGNPSAWREMEFK
ncbi:MULTISPECIES: hypothetical protein [Shouchella]|uniref:P68 RBP/TagC-like beta-propeller domain-containing protein n=2 Tax=Shouchella TaxID=2893057 RepID=A0ABY7W6T9_9BACI|nr:MULTISPECIES: hypothetical protein [Shouchella]MED4129086.1 hypothetical protein [Shouchella miscanthi]WDF04398.1 hypothetical protein PQ477_02665 [Shouchella hunanensis]